MEGELEDVVRAVVAAARGGDMVAARLVLERLAPARKGRPVTFMLPCGTDAAGLAAGFDAVLAATAAGELTPDEGASVSAVLEARRKVLETLDFAERLSAFEKRISRSTGRNKK
jgi:hypothetical protein